MIDIYSETLYLNCLNKNKNSTLKFVIRKDENNEEYIPLLIRIYNNNKIHIYQIYNITRIKKIYHNNKSFFKKKIDLIDLEIHYKINLLNVDLSHKKSDTRFFYNNEEELIFSGLSEVMANSIINNCDQLINKFNKIYRPNKIINYFFGKKNEGIEIINLIY